jgi:hypothetical protein
MLLPLYISRILFNVVLIGALTCDVEPDIVVDSGGLGVVHTARVRPRIVPS